MPMRNVELTDHLDRFIESGISSGRFSDVSEIVAEGLLLLEERESEDEEVKLAWLRAATQEAFDAFDRGEGIPLETEADMDALFARAAEEAPVVKHPANV